nr:hypothetical protein [Tanacetum cinerariifolium]
MESINKSIDERSQLKRQYNRRVNKKVMQMQECKVVLGKAVDADLVIMDSSGTESGKKDTSSSSGNYFTHVVDADIRLVNDQVLFSEAKTTLICNLKNQIKSVKEASNEAKVKNVIDVIETINIELEHDVAKLFAANEQLHKENEHLKQTYKELYDSIKKTCALNKDNSDSLISQINQKSVENADLKAQIQEKVFVNAALKNELRRILIPLFASQVDEKNILSKLATPYYLPNVREFGPAKSHHVNAPSSSRNSKKDSYDSNDMAHNYFLGEARKKTQERNRNLKPREMPSARTHHTPNVCTPRPRSNNQTFKNFPASKSNVVQKADHSRNSSSFSNSKCVFNTNHDACLTKFLNEVNSRARKPSHKTTTRYKPVEKTSNTKKSLEQIPGGHMFSTTKSSAV